MTIVYALSILGTISSLLGNILIIMKKRSGWAVWIIGNICWILYNVFGDFNFPMVLMYAVYFVINISGFIRWGEKSNKN